MEGSRLLAGNTSRLSGGCPKPCCNRAVPKETGATQVALPGVLICHGW